MDSYDSFINTSNPPTSGELTTVQGLIDAGSLGIFGVAEAAIDFYVSNNGTSNVGRFQIQQVAAGQEYELAFYGSHRWVGSQTTFSVYDDNLYSNLLGSTTITHGNGAGTGNTSDVGVISGLTGPSNSNNIFYVQWEGTVTSTQGYINAMSISAIPEPSTLMLFGIAGIALIGFARRRK